MDKTLKQRFGKGKPTGVGGCACGGGSANPEQDRYQGKCHNQRIPVVLTIPAATVEAATGNVVTTGKIVFEPKHDGDFFDPDTFRVLINTYADTEGAVQDAEDSYLRSIKISKDVFDCLDSDEERGVPLAAYAQSECCDGLEVCWPQFENKKDGKNNLSLEFINAQVIRTDDGSGAPAYAGVAIRVRGYIKGRCIGTGFEKLCEPA